MFFRTTRDMLRSIEHMLKRMEANMALNFSGLQAAVTSLSTDVNALLTQIASGNPADQAAIDAVTKSLAALDEAVKTAEGATGATGAAGTGSTGPTGT